MNERININPNVYILKDTKEIFINFQIKYKNEILKVFLEKYKDCIDNFIKEVSIEFYTLKDYFKENEEYIKLNDISFLYKNYIFTKILNEEILEILKQYYFNLENIKDKKIDKEINIYITSNYRNNKYELININSLFNISPIKQLQNDDKINIIGKYLNKQINNEIQYEIIENDEKIYLFFSYEKFFELLNY